MRKTLITIVCILTLFCALTSANISTASQQESGSLKIQIFDVATELPAPGVWITVWDDDLTTVIAGPTATVATGYANFRLPFAAYKVQVNEQVPMDLIMNESPTVQRYAVNLP